jgi:hypothetical protein
VVQSRLSGKPAWKLIPGPRCHARPWVVCTSVSQAPSPTGHQMQAEGMTPWVFPGAVAGERREVAAPVGLRAASDSHLLKCQAKDLFGLRGHWPKAATPDHTGPRWTEGPRCSS